MSTSARLRTGAVRAHDDVLGYLVKHVHLELENRTDAALEPMGLTARDLGVLRVIAGGEAASQQDVARVLGVDRTSMVALLDALEDKKIIARRPAEHDRRRNVLELTTAGRRLFERAESAALATEQDYTSSLGARGTAELRRSLRSLLPVSDS